MKKLFEINWIKTLVSLILTFVIIQLLISLNIINSYLQSTLAAICINIILAVSLNLITGFTGQFSLGHAGFMSIGAYVCALITLRIPTIPGFILGVFAGAVTAAVIGVIVGLPTLRLRGDYLAIATLGMAEIIRIIFLNMDKITNGAAGLQDIPQFTNWAWLFLYTAGTILIISNFIKSSHGRACISIREDEIAAEAMGVNSTRYKVTAFTIGAFFAGIAGALYASTFNFIDPKIFGFSKSIDILVVVVLGGLGSISGSIIAAILLGIITTYLQAFANIQMILYSLALIIIMIFRPQGLMGSKELSLSIFNRLGNSYKSKKGRV
ncbi:MAG: branched-chain amino acid ABC transporter permease [Clostridiaceae bacterium]|nr:branched-chain amino acid ABC transporter permease [Clostridiaceae bacterium]